ncbi:hypothetical protein MP638_007412 [Amoeboaphelidium occidentale]|nr:hypothetical protein MP638_007412 [Amoeboaphelidium occidentale]
MTTAFTEIFDTFGMPSLSGDRLYWIRESKLYRSVLSGNNLDFDKILPLDYLDAFISTPLLLPTGQILVYFDHSFGNSFYKLLDPESGLFSEKLTQFDKHLSFQVIDNLLIGAQANNVVAYKLSDFQLAWNASSVVTTKILSVKVSAGIIYIQESDNIGLFNATSLESIVAMGLTPSVGRYTDTLDGVVFTIDGNGVLSYDINTGTPLSNYVGPQNIVMSVVAFENHLYVGSWDTNIYKYSIGTSEPLLLFQGHISIVFSLLLEAQLLYSGSNDWTVRKWNKDTGEALFVYGGYLSSPSPFVVDDYSLYTYERDQITVWSLFTNRVSQVYFEKSFVPISHHFNGGSLQSGTVDGSLIYWDVENGILSSKPLLGNSANPAYSFELQNQTYFIPKYDGSIIKWDYATSSGPTVMIGFNLTRMSAFTVYQGMILFFKKGEGFLKYYSNSQITTKIDITAFYSNVVVVIDDIIFSGNNDSTITRHSISDLKILSSTKAHDTEVTVLAGYGQFLVSGGNDTVLKKWERDSMNLVLVMRREIGNLGHLGGITSIFIIDDVLFSGSVDTTAKRWDLNTGTVSFTYTGHIKKIRCVYYHNSSLFTAGEDGLFQMFTVIFPKPISSSVTGTTALASRINPIVRPVNVDENAALSSFELIIIIASVAVALILSIFIFVRVRSLKRLSQTPDNSGKFSSFLDTKFVTAVQDQTLVQTSVGLSIPASKEVSETDFILKTLLGKGGGGSVYYAKALTKNLKKYGETVVAKVLQGNYSSLSEPAKAMFNQEIGIMEMLQFKGGFAEMLGYSLKPCTIIMKLYKHGSLANWIRSNHIGSLRAIMEFCLNIATSISTMHKLLLAHCDLKPDNILIDEDRPGHFKCVITDFGICHVLSESIIDAKSFNHINVRGFSVKYAPPEAFERFRRKIVTSSADEVKSGDVFSFGMILYEMLTRKSPWN